MPLELFDDRYSERYEGNALRIRIRKWIERSALGNCFIREDKLDYHYKYNTADTEYSWQHRTYSVSHGFMCFYFEEEIDAVQFKLVFAELTTDWCKVRPEHEGDPNVCSHPMGSSGW